MKKLPILLTVVTALTVLTVLPQPASAAAFPDIKSPVLLEAVNYLNEKEIIQGYPDGTFKPEQVINRAEALKIIFESRGIVVDDDTNSGFPDVDSSLWFSKYVTSAKKLGLIKGYADSTYKPTQFVNKAEFIKIAMLAQKYYSELPTTNYELPFTDLDPSAWYIPYLAFASEKSFVVPVDRFYPTNGMSRGEAAMIIYRIAKYNESIVADFTCPTCVNGVDLMLLYPFLKDSDLVEISDGKLIIGGEDVTKFAHDERSVRMELTAAETQYIIDYTPYEEKINFEEKYPEYYQRLLNISGGQQSGDSYLEGNGHIYLFSGKKFENCDCDFELKIINLYNNKGYTESFHDWIKTDNAKEKIFREVIKFEFRYKYLDE